MCFGLGPLLPISELNLPLPLWYEYRMAYVIAEPCI